MRHAKDPRDYLLVGPAYMLNSVAEVHLCKDKKEVRVYMSEKIPVWKKLISVPL